jgi:hypothetical protein
LCLLSNKRSVIDIHNGLTEVAGEKNRCCACKRWLKREDMHAKIAQQFRDKPITDSHVSNLTEALEIVWKRGECENQQGVARLRLSSQVEAAPKPDNASIRDDIMVNIAKPEGRSIGY